MIAEPLDKDDGITLVELLVYTILLAIVLIITGSLLISTLHSQRTVREQTEASTTGQVALRLIERSVRNSVTHEMPNDFDNNLLVTKVRVGQDPTLPSSWECRAWLFDPDTGDLRFVRVPATGTPLTAGLTPPVDTSGWELVFEQVSKVPGENFFDFVPFGGVKVSFDVDAGDSKVSFRSTAISRAQGSTTAGVDCS